MWKLKIENIGSFGYTLKLLAVWMQSEKIGGCLRVKILILPYI